MVVDRGGQCEVWTCLQMLLMNDPLFVNKNEYSTSRSKISLSQKFSLVSYG